MSSSASCDGAKRAHARHNQSTQQGTRMHVTAHKARGPQPCSRSVVLPPPGRRLRQCKRPMQPNFVEHASYGACLQLDIPCPVLTCAAGTRESKLVTHNSSHSHTASCHVPPPARQQGHHTLCWQAHAIHAAAKQSSAQQQQQAAAICATRHVATLTRPASMVSLLSLTRLAGQVRGRRNGD